MEKRQQRYSRRRKQKKQRWKIIERGGKKYLIATTSKNSRSASISNSAINRVILEELELGFLSILDRLLRFDILLASIYCGDPTVSQGEATTEQHRHTISSWAIELWKRARRVNTRTFIHEINLRQNSDSPQAIRIGLLRHLESVRGGKILNR